MKNAYWSLGPNESWLKCLKCNVNIPRVDAVEGGCIKCGSKFQPEFNEVEVETIHKFYRGGNSVKKTKGIVGVWEAGTEPIQAPNTTRFVCVSDTHEMEDQIQVPNGDVLLHAGDFTYTGSHEAIIKFNSWLEKLPHPHKVVIAGNHDVTFDIPYYKKYWGRYHNEPFNCNAVRNSLKSCIYLEDSEVEINGIRIWGSPWQPEFCNWAFNLDRGKPLADKWNLIPEGIDILMTHGPPYGYGDLCDHGGRVGCPDLRKVIEQLQPRVHVSGHIHEGRGIAVDDNTVYINASSVNLRYVPVFKAYIFDIE